MQQVYPFLEMCPECGRHGVIRITAQIDSSGFQTKNTAFGVLTYSYETNLITAEEYRKLYAEVSQAKFIDESDLTAHDDIILFRINWMHSQIKQGKRFSRLYQPCQPADPKPVPSLAEITKASSS